MSNEKNTIFVINTGSTSTKIAVFVNETLLLKKELFVDTESLRGFSAALDELDIRSEMVMSFLEENRINVADFDIVAARAGTLPPIQGGAYAVNDLMVDSLLYAPMAQHASSLSCMIGRKLAEPYGIPVIIYDCAGTDEFDDVAKVTGLKDIPLVPVSHVLNTRKVARDVAKQIGKPYEDCNFIVAHLGGGISINVHKKGRIVDSIFDDMGPMSPTRAGRIPTRFLAKLCYSGKYTYSEMRGRLTKTGGLMDHLGTQDLREVEKKIAAGDQYAKHIYDALIYQISKGIAELSAVTCGDVDRIILTGGMAHSAQFTDLLKSRVTFIAPVEVVAGEREMEALALGGLRILQGLESAKTYDVVPFGYESIEDFYQKINKGKFES